MDKSAAEIVFDEQGICNFCRQAQDALDEIEDEKENRNARIAEIIRAGRGKQYDCLIGLSGGVDSSLVLHYALELGLRPLCFSVDNGWNDPKADENIMRLVEGLKVPFYRYTIDLKRFRELQAAFIKAGVPNIEIPTDHILMAVSYELAAKYNIKWILSGGNVATESIMPPSWGYNARDLKHIRAIYRWAHGEELAGLPVCSLLDFNLYKWGRGIKTLYLLDYYDYNREQAIRSLEIRYGYQPYGEKHCENIFTWWFQNFYLFEKFGIDKRKAHLSSLINSGQMTREQALHELGKNPVYPQIGLEKKIMEYPKRSHDDFPKDEKLFNFISSLIRLLRRVWNS